MLLKTAVLNTTQVEWERTKKSVCQEVEKYIRLSRAIFMVSRETVSLKYKNC